MNKWLKRLSKREFLELHKKCFTDQAIKMTDRDDENGEYVFLEDGWETCDGVSKLETGYSYSDFNAPYTFDVDGDFGEVAKNFFEFMFNRFGLPYVIEFVSQKTGGADIRELLELGYGVNI